MGYEFKVHLREDDLAAFSRFPNDSKSVDELLTSIPIFKKKRGKAYTYCSVEGFDPDWYSTIHYDNLTLTICSYRDSDYRAIVFYLLEELMDICGHFEIEDA